MKWHPSATWAADRQYKFKSLGACLLYNGALGKTLMKKGSVIKSNE
jgi:hypothetical protein